LPVDETFNQFKQVPEREAEDLRLRQKSFDGRVPGVVVQQGDRERDGDDVTDPVEPAMA